MLTPLGISPSFGFGDRLGLATPGHIAALQNSSLNIHPIFAQQSVRERHPGVRQTAEDQCRNPQRSGSTMPRYIPEHQENLPQARDQFQRVSERSTERGR